MPLQNRVTPFGEFVAIACRGTLMGNRGVIHNQRREITKRWTTRRWISCALEFKGRRREVMTPNRWTELFFLDEATALASGHRPCYECRRTDAAAFRAAWQLGNADKGVQVRDRIDRVDDVLHGERTAPFETRPRIHVDDAPSGTMFTLVAGSEPLLRWAGASWLWSFDGYRPAKTRGGDRVRLITPASIVQALAAGYEPRIHPSAG